MHERSGQAYPLFVTLTELGYLFMRLGRKTYGNDYLLNSFFGFFNFVNTRNKCEVFSYVHIVI